MNVCVLVEEGGSLVCGPQIYGAVTLTEESTFSSAARNGDKRSRFHAVLSFILTPHSVPLISHFYSNSLDLHHPRSSLCINGPFMSHFSSSPQTSQTRTAWTKQKAVRSACWLSRAHRPYPCYPIQGRREAGDCPSMHWAGV